MVSSEGLECFGGQGYIEDTGYPAILRDSQVLSIWEGTTNVLSLDVLRSIEKSNGDVLNAYREFIVKTCELASKYDKISLQAKMILKNTVDLLEYIRNNQDRLVESARELSYSLSRIFIGNSHFFSKWFYSFLNNFIMLLFFFSFYFQRIYCWKIARKANATKKTFMFSKSTSIIYYLYLSRRM